MEKYFPQCGKIGVFFHGMENFFPQCGKTAGPQLFLFDLDGTLIDSRADLAAAVNAMRALHGLPALPLDRLAAYVGDGVRTLAVRCLSCVVLVLGLSAHEI